MLNRLHLISEKISQPNSDFWLAEMLYKYINGDLDHQTAENYQLTKYSNPQKTLESMVSRLSSQVNI